MYNPFESESISLDDGTVGTTMLAKSITWITNLILAAVLVLLEINGSVYAQETILPLPDGKRSLEVPLSGTAISQTVQGMRVTPTVFTFGKVDIGLSSTVIVKLQHEGESNSQPIEINDANLFGVNSDEFSTPFIGFVTLYPGDSLDVSLEFTPIYPGAKTAGLRLDIAGASAPHVLMINGSARYPLTSDLVSTKASQSFGQILLDVTATKTLVLKNDSEEEDAPSVNIISASLSGDTPQDFTVEFNPVTLGPGETANVKVKMKSSIASHKSAIVTFEHDGNNGPVEVMLEGDVNEPAAVPVNFSVSNVNNLNLIKGTGIRFGPDDRLYVTAMTGEIYVYDIVRNGANNYTASLHETINLVKNVQNHDDDGSPNNQENTRLVTGLLVTGTAAKPIIYTHSSDPRQGGGGSGNDKNLDTNSGILHKLTKNGSTWTMLDLVRGLPRSEENHAGNGMVMMGNKLLATQGGHTNMGAESNNFARTPEFALSGAILEFDLSALGNSTYDLPTLDDEDRSGVNDYNDPFGGNNGKNQAILETDGPVKIYAPGFRNPYSLALTESGNLYTIDNGPNSSWGGIPVNCTNEEQDTGATYYDGLHHLKQRGYYGGHPNPFRAKKSNKINDSKPQSPIEGTANPVECNYKVPGQDGALTLFEKSTNGLDEYRASNFGGAMKGDLIASAMSKQIYRLQLNNAGTQVLSKSVLKQPVGNGPLDLITQGDNDPFPGTIWVVNYSANYVTVLEPADY